MLRMRLSARRMEKGVIVTVRKGSCNMAVAPTRCSLHPTASDGPLRGYSLERRHVARRPREKKRSTSQSYLPPVVYPLSAALCGSTRVFTKS